MKYLVSLIILLAFFSKINLYVIFPTFPPSIEEKNCTDVKNPSKDACLAILSSDTQFKCCYVKGVGLSKCVFAENTEYGIDAYKSIYSDTDDFSIECGGNYLKNIFFLFFLLIIEYI